jgi:hypothetical protein
VNTSAPDNDPADRLVFQDHLLKDERLLWVGRPGQGLHPPALSLAAVILPLGCVVFAAAASFENLSKGHHPVSGEVVVAGAAMLWWFANVFVAPFRDAAERAGQIYAVTSRRIFISRPGKMAAVWIEDMHGLSLERDRTVVIATRQIEPRGWWARQFDQFDLVPATHNERLLYLRDAARVFKLISAVRSGQAPVALAA